MAILFTWANANALSSAAIRKSLKKVPLLPLLQLCGQKWAQCSLRIARAAGYMNAGTHRIYAR